MKWPRGAGVSSVISALLLDKRNHNLKEMSPGGITYRPGLHFYRLTEESTSVGNS